METPCKLVPEPTQGKADYITSDGGDKTLNDGPHISNTRKFGIILKGGVTKNDSNTLTVLTPSLGQTYRATRILNKQKINVGGLVETKLTRPKLFNLYNFQLK